MKESDQKEDEPLIKEFDNPPLLKKTSTEDELDSKTKKENRDRELAKEIRRSYFYNMKDYIFFFSLMISPSNQILPRANFNDIFCIINSI